jgi:hypothetical protein
VDFDQDKTTRPEPFYLGIAFVMAGTLLSVMVHQTSGHSSLESRTGQGGAQDHESRQDAVQ